MSSSPPGIGFQKISLGPPGFGYRTCMAYSASGYKTRLNRSQDWSEYWEIFWLWWHCCELWRHSIETKYSITVLQYYSISSTLGNIFMTLIMMTLQWALMTFNGSVFYRDTEWHFWRFSNPTLFYQVSYQYFHNFTDFSKETKVWYKNLSQTPIFFKLFGCRCVE